MAAWLLYLSLSVLGSAPAAIAALMAYLKTRENEERLVELRRALNGRLDELVEERGREERAAGRQEGAAGGLGQRVAGDGV